MVIKDSMMHSVIEDALRKFWAEDALLVRVGARKETIAHRLAVRLEHELSTTLIYSRHNVDLLCEKRAEGVAVRVDIVVHERGTHARNAIALACAVNALSRQEREKLVRLASPPFRFGLCLAVVFRPDKDYFLFYVVNKEGFLRRRIKKDKVKIR